jgi:hypothetical protein
MNSVTSDPRIGWAAIIIITLLVAIIIIKEGLSIRWPQHQIGTGIRVGQPKVYDNRSLALMLEQLQNQVRDLEKIDSGTVTGALGSVQQESKTRGETALKLTTDAGTSGNGDDASKDGDPTVNKNNSDGSAQAEPSSLKWSERASDLLTDQVNLSYQSFNLRLLLERAISDRVFEDTGEARVQAVIGFPISIDPPWFSIGCAGTVEVELTLEPGESGQRENGPSLVALFPQEETYNTWSVDHRRFQLGAPASFQGLQVTGSGSTEVERSGFRRQADIVAIEREIQEQDPNPYPLVVAWQFRPSPGDHKVAAGLRQMLALVSLPRSDEENTTITMQMRVRSFWERRNRRAGFGWRAFLTERPTSNDFGPYQKFEVCTTKKLDTSLAPTIENIAWYRVGTQRAAVVVTGKNFFTGTTVTMGDTILGTENDKGVGRVTIKSQKTLVIDAPLSGLLYDVVLDGRYGPSIELQEVSPPDKFLLDNPDSPPDPARPRVPKLNIRKAWIDPLPGNQSYIVKIEFSSSEPDNLRWEEFVKLPDPILAINGKVVPDLLLFSWWAKETSAEAGQSAGAKESVATVTTKVAKETSLVGVKQDSPVRRSEAPFISARVSVAPEFITDSPVLVVRWPFYGEDWLLNYQISFSRSSIAASRFASDNKGNTTILLSGRNFSSEVIVFADRDYKLTDKSLFETTDKPLSRLASDLLKVELPTATVDAHPIFFVCQPDQPSVSVQVPAAKEVPCPKLDILKKPPVLNIKTSCSIDLSGTGLRAITKASFGKDETKFLVNASGTSVSIIIGDDLLTSPGTEVVRFATDTGLVLTQAVLILPADAKEVTPELADAQTPDTK